MYVTYSLGLPFHGLMWLPVAPQDQTQEVREENAEKLQLTLGCSQMLTPAALLPAHEGES